MEDLTMFKNLESLIKKEYTIKRAEVSYYINYGYFRHWSEEHRKNSDDTIEPSELCGIALIS